MNAPRRLKMVNPLMSSHVAKMEPIVSFGLGDCGTSEESNSVKIELENCDNTNEPAVKMELDEFQGLFDNDHEQLRLSDSESKDSLLGSDMLLGPSSSYSSDPVGLSMIRTVNLSKGTSGTDTFPVLSIPNSSIFSISTASLEIAMSPVSSQGPDTTTLTSPPPSSSSQSAQRKTAYTAKGFSFSFSQSNSSMAQFMVSRLWLKMIKTTEATLRNQVSYITQQGGW